jgi:hypothetical protein
MKSSWLAAFTLWNLQPDNDVVISADLVGISVGRNGAPVRGSGVFVGGSGGTGGRLNMRRLETGAVYSDGGIEPGTPDRISGGVFVVYGAYADLVRNRGPVTTYGANDMVLDNWGTVDRWVADDKITSHGSSGIGFVNFGTINVLKMNAPIETLRPGCARLQRLHWHREGVGVRAHCHARRRSCWHTDQPADWPHQSATRR